MADQAETFLMRLIRGAGLRGLAAMRPVGAVPSSDGATAFDGATLRRGEGATRLPVSPSPRLPLSPSPLLIRPLLCITREEIEAYCRERGLAFRTDVTNFSFDQTRNRIRNEILPALKAINPRVVESIARAAENAGNDHDALDDLALLLLERARLEVERRSGEGNTIAYSVDALLEQTSGMRRRMIIEAIRLARSEKAGGEITSKHVTAVEALLAPEASGKHITLPRRLEVWREFDTLVFRTADRADRAAIPYEFELSVTKPNTEAGGFVLTLQRSLGGERLKSIIEDAQREKRAGGRDWIVVALDDRSLPERLTVRPRLSGERVLVIGQQQTIKLKKLMIDHRIPSSHRAAWPVVATSDGYYVWSPGLPPASEFAARDESQSLAVLRASPCDSAPESAPEELQWKRLSE
jgi:tRNA(Ile)-lysidine synthetase-like protein